MSVLDDEHLVFADLRSPGTVANLRLNPNVEINVVDPFVRKGFRFKGRGEVLEQGEQFDKLVAFFSGRGLSEAPRRIQTIVVVRVDQARPLVSPGYDDAPDENTMRERWTRYYLGDAAEE
jgi:hypothetical protein